MLTLSGLYSVTRFLWAANLLGESMQSAFDIIQECGEELPQPMDNEKLINKMKVMNDTLESVSDESILNMRKTNNRKIVTVLKLYATLASLLHFTKQSLVGAVSLRMVDLTLKYGLTSVCPIAFARYGGTLASMGKEHVTEGCRLGV